MATKTVFITTVGTGTYTIPNDFGSLVSVEAIGGGGSGAGGSPTGAGGGGGGAYAKSTTMTGLSAGLTVYYQVGTGGGTTGGGSPTADSWFSLTNGKPNTSSNGADGVNAAGGVTTTTGSGGAGGSSGSSAGDVRNSGGTGGTASSGRGAGGGAAGPGGSGGTGGAGSSTSAFGGGGGSGATLTVSGTIGQAGQTSTGGAGGASTGQTGGSGATSTLAANNTAPANGGGGGGGYASGFEVGGAGSNGTYWTQTSDSATAGSGGGSGAAAGAASGNVNSAGLYGGGGGGGNVGGTGAQGIIVFTYNLAEKTVFLTTTGSGTYKIPSDFVSLISVEAIGGGGGGVKLTSGGGGGGYSKSTSITGLVAGQTCYYSVGAGGAAANNGNDTWFNAVANSAPTIASNGVLAKLGSSNGSGGAAASGVGDLKYSGGNGGSAADGGAGGGAAGPGGNGGAGGGTSVSGTRGGGGGGGGASLTAAGNNGIGTDASTGSNGGAGGNGGGGTGGGAGATSGISGAPGTAGTGGGGGGGYEGQIASVGGAGGTGSYWTSSNGETAGSGGGGGAAGGSTDQYTAGAGGLYGGGGGTAGSGSSGAGAQGIVVFTYAYNAALYQTKTVFLTTTGVGTYRVPNDFVSFVSVEAIGGGGSSANKDYGGGGGAYAKSTSATLTAGQTCYYQVGVGGISTGGTATDSWFNAASNAAPTLASQGVLAKAANASTGGASASCVGDVKYSGGSGGTTSRYSGAGGAAGPGGAGGNGGDGDNVSGGSGGGGGGAGLTSPGSNGQTVTFASNGTLGGTGGNGGGGSGGGTAGNASSGGNGTAGTGGGGGGAANGSGYNGGNGASGSIWTQTSNGATAGPGGGAGGGTTNGAGTAKANGGLYGGGGGSNVTQPSAVGDGAQGIIVFTYVAFLGQVYPSPKPPSNFQKDDPIYGKVDLDETYVTDAWLLEKYVGNNLFSWGSAVTGGMGDNTTANKSSPIQIGRLSTWRSVATAGGTTGTFTLSTKTDGTLWAFGENANGQLGRGNTTNLSSPVQVGTLTNWRQVSVGRNFSAAVKTDNTLWTWGENTAGNLGGLAAGTGNTVDRSSPVQIGTAYSWKQVSAGGGGDGNPANDVQYTMAVANDGELWAIGGVNTFGGLGDGTTTTRSSPVQIGALTQWSSVSAGYQHTMAIQTDGTLWGWGNNETGQLGTPSYYATAWSSPVQVGSLTSWASVAATPAMYAVKTDGSLWYWGSQGVTFTNLYGNGTTTAGSISSPVQLGSLTNWSQITAGNHTHILAVKTDNTLWAWGRNASGQLGTGSTTVLSSPVQVGTLTNWASVSSKNSVSFSMVSSCAAIKTDGTLWTWGNNIAGVLGSGNTVTRSSPVQVGSLSNWAQVDIINSNTTSNDAICAAVKTDGSLWSWGFGPGGALGGLASGAGTTLSRSSPVQVGSLTNWRQVQVGRSGATNNLFCLAVKTDNTLWAWGANNLGQFGDGTTTTRSSPVQVGSLSDWSSISLTSIDNAPVIGAIKTDGSLWVWGANTSGQLGIGSTVAQLSSPVQVGTLTNWSSVSGHFGAMIADKTDGTLWSSGNLLAAGYAGGVGTSFIDDRYYSSPIQIGQLTNWKSVAANFNYTLALKTNNTLWAWGNNVNGNLGDGTTVDKESPIQVGFLTDWKSLAQISTSERTAPGAPSGAVKTDGTLWVWGVGTSGVLGDGTTVSKSSPIQIGFNTNWKQVSLSNRLSGKGITFNDI